MNTNDPRHPWQRLIAVARRADDGRDAAAPYGFATRVAALAFSQEQTLPPLILRLAPRALGIACLLMLASLVLNYKAFTTPTVDAESLLSEEESAVIVMLDAS